VGTQPGASAEPVAAIYRHALPQVYGYLLPRCGSTVVAEDLTAETFMAAVTAFRQGRIEIPELTVAWLVGVARHKLADHWRRSAREQRDLAAVAVVAEETSDLGRSVHATETLLVRARAALRRVYREEGSGDA
jgi:RNA polymerase sigma-70 factor, ECF subfamily